MFIMPLGSYLTQKGWKPKTLIAIGAAVMFPFFVLSTIVNQFWAFAMFYILAFSWNQGICYMTPIHQGWAWFPCHGGLVSGIIIGGFGFGPLIFDNVITRTINPENLPVDLSTGYYDASVDDNFLFTWRIVIASWFALAVIGFFTIFEGPKKAKREDALQVSTVEEVATETDQLDSEEPVRSGNLNKSAASVFGESDNVSVSEAQASVLLARHQPQAPVKTPVMQMVCARPFILLYVMNTLSLITGIFAINNFKLYGQKNGLTNENYLAWVGSVAAVCNAIRFIWSTATDYVPYKSVYAVLLCIQIVLNFTIPFVSKDNILYALWISGMLLCEGGHFTLVPNVLKKIYGAEAGTLLYGFLFSYSGIVSILIIVLQALLLTDNPRSYNIFFYINGTFSVIALGLLCFLFSEEKFIHKN